MGVHRTARLPGHAPHESLAGPAMGAIVDDPGYKDGRWLALVWAGDPAAHRRGPSTILRNRGSGKLRRVRHFRLQSIEKTQPAAATLPVGATLLVESSASGPVFISLRAHDDGFLYCAGCELFLSIAGGAALLSRHQHRRFPHCAGNAFPERRAGRNGSGSGARLRLDHSLRIVRLGVTPDTPAGITGTFFKV